MLRGYRSKKLPLILYQTTPRSSIRKTPFRLAYDTNALLPVKVRLYSYRHEVFNVEMNEWGFS